MFLKLFRSFCLSLQALPGRSEIDDGSVSTEIHFDGQAALGPGLPIEFYPGKFRFFKTGGFQKNLQVAGTDKKMPMVGSRGMILEMISPDHITPSLDKKILFRVSKNSHPSGLSTRCISLRK